MIMTKQANNIIECTSREEWLQARAGGIGGSDAAVIFGASKWKSPYGLWAEKSGLIHRSVEQTELMRWGHIMEPVIAKEYAELTGRKVTNLGSFTIRVHPRLPFMCCTHDFIVEAPEHDRPGPLSIKTAGWMKKDEWTDAQAPVDYEIQLQHEIAVMGDTDWGSFAVLIWGQGVKWFDRMANTNFIESLERGCGSFWNRVQTGSPPPLNGHADEWDAVRAFYPQAEPGKVIELGQRELEWTNELSQLRGDRLTIEKREKHLKSLIIEAIGDAEEATLPDGRSWTFRGTAESGRTLRAPKDKKDRKTA
jgi:putative phage-type endonuclease